MNKLNKSVEDIRKELFEFIESKQDDYVVKGFLPAKVNLNKGILRGMLEVFIFGIWQLYNTMSKILMQAIPIHSTGDWLKLHVESVGLTPKKKSKAIGLVQFTRDDIDKGDTTTPTTRDNSNTGDATIPTTSKKRNITILKNKIVGTLPDGLGKVYRYVVTKDTVLLAEDDYVFVEVESEDFGEQVNAEHGMITQLITPISGISSVNNIKVEKEDSKPDPITGKKELHSWLISEGTDDESDSLLRERYIAQWQRITGVTSNAYMAAALSVNSVTSVSVDDQHPGKKQGAVNIYIRTSAKGDGADKTLIDVKTAIEKEIMINDIVDVMHATTVAIKIDIEVEAKGVVSDKLHTTVKNNIKAYIDTLVIGEDVVRDKVASTIINIEGVRKINWLCFSKKSEEYPLPVEPVEPTGPTGPVEESIIIARSELAEISTLLGFLDINVKEFIEESDEITSTAQ